MTTENMPTQGELIDILTKYWKQDKSERENAVELAGTHDTEGAIARAWQKYEYHQGRMDATKNVLLLISGYNAIRHLVDND